MKKKDILFDLFLGLPNKEDKEAFISDKLNDEIEKDYEKESTIDNMSDNMLKSDKPVRVRGHANRNSKRC